VGLESARQYWYTKGAYGARDSWSVAELTARPEDTVIAECLRLDLRPNIPYNHRYRPRWTCWARSLNFDRQDVSRRGRTRTEGPAGSDRSSHAYLRGVVGRVGMNKQA
jgi:hypothetical protein